MCRGSALYCAPTPIIPCYKKCTKTLNQSLIKSVFLPVVALLFHLSAVAAPTTPDAGQMTRELQKQPDVIPPKSNTPVRLESAPVISQAGHSQQRFKVNSIRIEGNTVFTTPELYTLVAYLVGGEHTTEAMEAAAARISNWYRAHGNLVARAYLPAQEIQAGILTLRVLEGRHGKQHLHNQSRLSDTLIYAYLHPIQTGDIVRAAPIDRALLLLADTPGIGGTRAILQPGASVGTSDLLVELDPATLYAANIELNNHGNRYTGEHYLRAGLDLNSPLHQGDQLSVRALTSDQNMTYARLAYQLPLGQQGLKIGAAYSNTRYQLGKEFSNLQAHGSADNTSYYLSYPFVRSIYRNLFGTFTFENKQLSAQTGNPVSFVYNQVQLFNIGVAGKQQDALWGGGISTLEVAWVRGKLSLDSALLAADAAGARTAGGFNRFAYGLYRLQRLNDKQSLSINLTGQLSRKNLYASEEFSLGGANGVRAYPQGEGSGDQGWMGNIELRHRFQDNLQGTLFYDMGAVKINRSPFAAVVNARNLAGAGLGVQAQYDRVQLKTFLAWRTQGGLAQSEPTNPNPRIWLQLSANLD